MDSESKSSHEYHVVAEGKTGVKSTVVIPYDDLLVKFLSSSFRFGHKIHEIKRKEKA